MWMIDDSTELAGRPTGPAQSQLLPLPQVSAILTFTVITCSCFFIVDVSLCASLDILPSKTFHVSSKSHLISSTHPTPSLFSYNLSIEDPAHLTHTEEDRIQIEFPGPSGCMGMVGVRAKAGRPVGGVGLGLGAGPVRRRVRSGASI